MPSSEISAIIVAGGQGSRFGGERPKQLALLAGRPVLTHTLATFEAMPQIGEIVLVLPGNWLKTIKDEAVLPYNFQKVFSVPGGAIRAESTRRGFEASCGKLVLVHDGMRPLVTPDLIKAVIAAAQERGAALAAVPVRDTLKKVADGLTRQTIDRSNFWQAQTPQGFHRKILLQALANTGVETATDDSALLEPLGQNAAVVLGLARNFKITTREDLFMAEALLSAATLVRTGHGYDFHRLQLGRPLFLGCLHIPFEYGLLGHSDADVLAHALGDALLGAAGLADLGQHFPDNDSRWIGISGADLLAEIMAKVRIAGLELMNADLTLIGEKPKIAPYRERISTAIAQALQVPITAINVKATTTEGLGPTSQGQALAALATATLRVNSFTNGPLYK